MSPFGRPFAVPTPLTMVLGTKPSVEGKCGPALAPFLDAVAQGGKLLVSPTLHLAHLRQPRRVQVVRSKVRLTKA